MKNELDNRKKIIYFIFFNNKDKRKLSYNKIDLLIIKKQQIKKKYEVTCTMY